MRLGRRVVNARPERNVGAVSTTPPLAIWAIWRMRGTEGIKARIGALAISEIIEITNGNGGGRKIIYL